jgi:P27 family predicted phage terminase small subunit
MGLRGPAPKPSAIEKLEGNPGHRAINTREPMPAPGEPKMPAQLDAAARMEWRRLVPILQRMRVLTEADGLALANLCADVSLLMRAQESLAKTGLFIKNPKTEMVHQNPVLNLIRVTTDRVTRGLREFGLTPASRSKVQAVEETKDDFLALLSAPRELRPN